MKSGEIVELGQTGTLFTAPRQDYTKELLGIARSLDRTLSRQTAGQ